MLSDKRISVGQEVSLGGDNPDWLLVDRTEGGCLRVRRSYGNPAAYSSGFWTDVQFIRASRWPVSPPR